MSKRCSLLILFKSNLSSSHIVASLIGLGICFCSYGQTKWGIRLNQNTDLFSVVYPLNNASYSKESKRNFDRFSLAILLFNRKDKHELEFFIPQVGGSSPKFPWAYSVSFPENRYDSYSLRYAVSREVASPIQWLSFSFGGGLNGYLSKVEGVIQSTGFYPVTNTNIGMSVNAISGLNLKVSKQLSLMFDCPLKVFDIYHKTIYIENPAIPINQQKERSFNSDFLMKALTVRIGVAYKFDK